MANELSPQLLGALESKEFRELLLFFGQDKIEDSGLLHRMKVFNIIQDSKVGKGLR